MGHFLYEAYIGIVWIWLIVFARRYATPWQAWQLRGLRFRGWRDVRAWWYWRRVAARYGVRWGLGRCDQAAQGQLAWRPDRLVRPVVTFDPRAGRERQQIRWADLCVIGLHELGHWAQVVPAPGSLLRPDPRVYGARLDEHLSLRQVQEIAAWHWAQAVCPDWLQDRRVHWHATSLFTYGVVYRLRTQSWWPLFPSQSAPVETLAALDTSARMSVESL